MHFPSLTSTRLLLKPITYKDSTNLFNLLNQYEVCLYNNFSALENKAQAQDLIQQDLENSYNNVGIRFCINTLLGEFIGSCGVHEYDKLKKIATIGYELDPKHWRQGYMNEALVHLFDFLFSDKCTFEVNKLQAKVLNLNIPSIKLLEKMGFEICTNTLELNDISQYQLTKEFWLNKNNKVI